MQVLGGCMRVMTRRLAERWDSGWHPRPRLRV